MVPLWNLLVLPHASRALRFQSRYQEQLDGQRRPLRSGHLFYRIVYMASPSLGDFEFVVLLSVARLGDDAYGLQIRRDVSALKERDYSVGAIYTTLQRLVDKELLESWLTEPLPVRGGRARRQFRVTPKGHRAMNDARERAVRLWAALDITPTAS